MLNSVIVTHRDRPKSLAVFLRSFEIAAQHSDPDDFEIIIADLNSKSPCDEIAERFSRKFKFRFLKIKYDKIFWKTKALNYCVRESRGDFITMLDIDSLVPPMFLYHIREFYSDPKHKRKKLAYRVCYLFPDQVKYVTSHENFDEYYIRKNIVALYPNYRFARERFMVDGKMVRQDPKFKIKKIPEHWYRKYVLGNSHHTVSRDAILSIGGWNEKFKGHGLEDVEYNIRLFRHIQNGTLERGGEFVVYHITHDRDQKRWDILANRNKNRIECHRVRDNPEICVLKKGEDWGVFPEG